MRNKPNPAIIIEQSLEHRILHGLSLEWEVALWVLDIVDRTRMQKPRFILRDMGQRLGTWSTTRKEIALNRQFVTTHPWTAVREVLLHEMAHQLADEVYGGLGETAHGPVFKKACRCLRIDPAATADYRGLQFPNESGPIHENDRILLRIKKLLALAESQNAHEAEAAMLKAHELIAKYHVDLFMLETKREYVSRIISRPDLRHSRDKYLLSALLQDYYFVQGIWVPVYVVEKGKMGHALEISGVAADVDLAAYVFDFVIGFINCQWHHYRRFRSHRGNRKIDFAVGVVTGFRDKLENQKQHLIETQSSHALIAQKDPQLIDYMAFKHPRTSRIHHRTSFHGAEAYSHGMEIGRNLVIFRGITNKGEGTGFLPIFKSKTPAGN